MVIALVAILTDARSTATEGAQMDGLREVSGLREYPLARRGLMMGGLISSFTLATTRRMLARFQQYGVAR